MFDGRYFLFCLWVSFCNVDARTNCINLDVVITQNVEGLGFHRHLNWLIETDNLDKNAWLNASCNTAVMLNVEKGMYVNPDQIGEIRRRKNLDVIIDGLVDIEAPAHEATPHTVYIFFNNSEFINRITVRLPIHLRYQRSLLGGFGKVILTKPSILVSCPVSDNIICGNHRKVKAPISSEDIFTKKTWKNVTYIAHFDEMELFVPVGNLDDYPYVAIISCVLGCIGCCYILSLLSIVGRKR